MSSLTALMSRALARWIRLVLRFRKTVVLVSLALAALSVFYASGRLGINTDTADMISPELPWRQDFIEYRSSFPARDRNIVVVVGAPSAERADAFVETLVARLESQPELFRSVFAPGIGEFFERNGLLFLPLDELERLTDRLAAAQPLLGLLEPRFDGAAVVDLVGRTLQEAPTERREPVADALYAELAAALDAARSGRSDPVSWRSLFMGNSVGDPASTSAAATAADGAQRLVLLRPELDFDLVQPAAAAVEALRAKIDAQTGGEYRDVTARLTGSVAMEYDEMLSVRRSAGLAGLASLIMVAVVMYAALRSTKLLAFSMLTLSAGLAGTAAFAAGTVGHLNLLSVAFAVLYIGLGVDFILHVCLRFKELVARGAAVDEAIVDTIAGVGTSLVICAVTTAAGFYVFIPTAFQGVAELGLISGTGMFVSLIASLTLLPALLGAFPPAPDKLQKASWIGTRSLARLTARPRRVLVVSAVIVAASVLALPKLEFDNNPVNLRDPASESVQALADLAANSDAPLFDLVAVAPDHGTAVEWAETLRSLPTVRRVTTVDALVPDEQQDKLIVLDDIRLIMGPNFADLERAPPDADRLEQSLAALQQTLDQGAPSDPAARSLGSSIDALLAELGRATPAKRQRVLGSLDEDIAAGLPRELERLATGLEAEPVEAAELPDDLTERWIGSGGRELIEITPEEDVSDNAAARRFVDSVRNVVPSSTGLPVVYQEASETVVQSFQLALAYASLMVVILLWVFLRSVRDIMLVMVPISLAALVTAGAAVMFGIPFNFANIIALPLLVGIGVDNGIHIVHRLRTDSPADGSLLATSTPAAMLASTLTTIASFGNLAFSAHRGMASMGQLLTIGMLVTLAATLIVLPALLQVRKPA